MFNLFRFTGIPLWKSTMSTSSCVVWSLRSSARLQDAHKCFRQDKCWRITNSMTARKWSFASSAVKSSREIVTWRLMCRYCLYRTYWYYHFTCWTVLSGCAETTTEPEGDWEKTCCKRCVFEAKLSKESGQSVEEFPTFVVMYFRDNSCCIW